MKRLGLRHVRDILALFLVLSTLFFQLIPLANAQIYTTVSVLPSLVTDKVPGDSFSVGIRITNGSNVYSWEFELSYAPYSEILTVTDVREGPFLQGGGDTYMVRTIDNSAGLVQAGCTLTGEVPGVYGDGILAIVDFEVVGGGECVLDLHDTVLTDPDGVGTTPNEVDGYFSGNAPYADFTYSPRYETEGYYPAANQTITFNASLSYDPDGTIATYYWDFYDGTTNSTGNAIITHVFAEVGIYYVNLTVTDNEGNKDWSSQSVDIVLRDVAVTNIDISPLNLVRPGYLVDVNVTVHNYGALGETYNVTAYANNTILGARNLRALGGGQSETVAFNWNTTGAERGTYIIRANASSIFPGDNNQTNNQLTGVFTLSLPSGIRPKIYVYPSEITLATPKYPPDTFTIYVNVSGAIDLYAWEFSVSWNASMLDFVEVTEGDFLQSQPEGTLFANQTYEDEIDKDYITVSCTTVGTYQGVYGDGTLAAVTFKVQSNGSTTLTLFNAILWDQAMTPLTHTSADGFFINEPIEHEIKVLLEIPASPIIGETYLINATATNIGLNNETNVDLQIIVEGTIVDFTIISELLVGESYTLTYSWTPTVSGTYNITAYAPPLPDEATTTNNMVDMLVVVQRTGFVLFPVTIYGATFMVSIETDESTTIQNFMFNYTGKQIRFTVGGVTDTTSFCNVTIPQNLLNVSTPDDWIVELDATQIDYVSTRNQTHYFIFFTYTFSSTYSATIEGTWVNTPPSAVFTPSTTEALEGEPVIFNATNSYDPDQNGRIAEYFFDFGDGTDATGTPNYEPTTGQMINVTWVFSDGTNTTATHPIVEHTYQNELDCDVALTVTDKDGLKNTTSLSLGVYGEYDIGIVDILVYPITANIGESVLINVTITSRLRSERTPTLLNLVIYGNDSILVGESGVTAPPEGLNKTLECIWNTTGTMLGVYRINASITVTRIGQILVADYPFPEVDLLANEIVFGDIRVKKWDSLVSILVPSSFTVGTATAVTGSLIPSHEGANVTIQVKSGEGDWSSIATVTTIPKGIYQYTWTPTTAGTYQIRATWPGDAINSANMSDAKTVTVKQAFSTISIGVNLNSVALGSSVVVTGKITPERQDLLITINVRKDGGVWTFLPTTVVTDSQGNYSYEWTPAEAGTYEVQTLWEGDVNTLGSESEIRTVTVEAAASTDIYMYAAAAVIVIAVALLAVYFLRKR
jgi:hypothetical protein